MDIENQLNVNKSSFQTPGKNKLNSSGPLKTPNRLESRPKSATCTKLSSSLRTPLSPLNSSGSIISTISSSSDAREAARMAKIQTTNSRIQKVAELKEKWAKEKEQKSVQYKEKRAKELKKLQDESEFNAEIRRKNLEKQKELEEKEKQTKQEQLQASLEARTLLAADLEKEAKAKRRISIFLNQQMRKRAVAKEAELNTQKKEFEDRLMYDRRLDYLQIRESKKEEDMKRRESLMNHSLIAQEQKKIMEELESEQKFEDFKIFEMRKLNFEDEQRYKKKKDDERRQSLAFRLEKWREEKNWEKAQKEQERIAKEYEDELQRQAREDMKRHEQEMLENRRNSLLYRLDKAKKDENHEQAEQMMLREMENEERRIAALDREDVQQYRQCVLESRRQSLVYRNQLEFQERMRMEGVKHSLTLIEQSDREIRYDGWKDVQKYREKQREDARRSLAWRLADAHRQHELELAFHQEQMLKMHYDLHCRREDWLAMKQHREDEKERRRKSLALRLDSWKQCQLQDEKVKQQQEMQREEDALLREMDREDLMAAKLANEMMDKRQQLSVNTAFSV